MHAIQANTVNDAYYDAIQAVFHQGRRVPSRLADTLEISPMIVEIRNPTQRIVTAWGRPLNLAFAYAEVLWILSGRSDVEMVGFYNSQMKEYSDDGHSFNAAYGQRLRWNFGIDQIEHAIATLREDEHSRQVTLVITDPVKDRSWSGLEPGEIISRPTGKHETKDRACNVVAHLLIRDGALDWLQVMRSNDACWGTPYNWIQFTHLQEHIARQIGVEVGRYRHVADSFHIYEYHWPEAREIAMFDLYREMGLSPGHPGHQPMPRTNVRTFSEVCLAERSVREGSFNGYRPSSKAEEWWLDPMELWVSYAAFKAGKDGDALERLLFCRDEILGAGQARFLWQARWGKDTFSVVEQARLRYRILEKWGNGDEDGGPIGRWILGDRSQLVGS